MRTQIQINKIKEKQSTPKQQLIFLNELEVDQLLTYYNNNADKAEIKPTGPKCLYIKEGEGVIDYILVKLRNKFGDFKLRNAPMKSKAMLCCKMCGSMGI